MQFGSDSLEANLVDGHWMELAARRAIEVTNPAIDGRSGRPSGRDPAQRSFQGKDDQPPCMETRRLLQESLTRARHFAFILSGTKNATLDVILADRH